MVLNVYLSFSSNTTVESLERDDFFVFHDVLEVLDGTAQWHVLNGMSDLSGVLEVHSQVGAARFNRLGRVLRFSRIASHLYNYTSHTGIYILKIKKKQKKMN